MKQHLSTFHEQLLVVVVVSFPDAIVVFLCPSLSLGTPARPPLVEELQEHGEGEQQYRGRQARGHELGRGPEPDDAAAVQQRGDGLGAQPRDPSHEHALLPRELAVLVEHADDEMVALERVGDRRQQLVLYAGTVSLSMTAPPQVSFCPPGWPERPELLHVAVYPSRFLGCMRAVSAGVRAPSVRQKCSEPRGWECEPRMIGLGPHSRFRGPNRGRKGGTSTESEA